MERSAMTDVPSRTLRTLRLNLLFFNRKVRKERRDLTVIPLRFIPAFVNVMRNRQKLTPQFENLPTNC